MRNAKAVPRLPFLGFHNSHCTPSYSKANGWILFRVFMRFAHLATIVDAFEILLFLILTEKKYNFISRPIQMGSDSALDARHSLMRAAHIDNRINITKTAWQIIKTNERNSISTRRLTVSFVWKWNSMEGMWNAPRHAYNRTYADPTQWIRAHRRLPMIRAQ